MGLSPGTDETDKKQKARHLPKQTRHQSKKERCLHYKVGKGKKQMLKQQIIKRLESEKTRSAWNRGVIEYALELLENIESCEQITIAKLLNGAQNWSEYICIKKQIIHRKLRRI